MSSIGIRRRAVERAVDWRSQHRSKSSRETSVAVGRVGRSEDGSCDFLLAALVAAVVAFRLPAYLNLAALDSDMAGSRGCALGADLLAPACRSIRGRGPGPRDQGRVRRTAGADRDDPRPGARRTQAPERGQGRVPRDPSTPARSRRCARGARRSAREAGPRQRCDRGAPHRSGGGPDGRARRPAAAIDGRLEALESGVEMPAAAPHPGATGP